MILSVSRRTDIPAFYTDWLFNRLRAGFVCVRNPVNPRKISKLQLSPDVVDGIVFWTKNPIPMLPRLQELNRYAYYVQFTLTPYGKDIEPNLPVKLKLMSAFRRLSDQIGPERVVWRYDPILVNASWTPQAHLRAFSTMAGALAGATRRVVISFVDTQYRNCRRNAGALAVQELTARERLSLAAGLAQIARSHGMEMCACAESLDLSACGVMPSHCIDPSLLEAQLGCRLPVAADPHQRPGCGCAQSVDIGAYNTCENGCRYCYANYHAGEIQKNRALHNPLSPLLIGEIGAHETVTERFLLPCRDGQLRLPLDCAGYRGAC